MRFKEYLNEEKFKLRIGYMGSEYKNIAKKAIKYLETKWKDVPKGEIEVGGHSVSDAGIGGFRVGTGGFSGEEYTASAFSLLSPKDEIEIKKIAKEKKVPYSYLGFLVDFFHEAAHTSGIENEIKSYDVGAKHLIKFLKGI